MKYELIIFDWDGTLVDSTGRIVESLASAAEDAGLPPVATDEIRSIIGLGLPEAVKTVWPMVVEEQYAVLSDRYSKHFEMSHHVAMAPYTGVIDLLEYLHPHKLLAVATGKSRRGLDKVMLDLNMKHFFHATRCADETLSKPNPLMLIELLQQLGVSSDMALMVGDTTYDLDMAAAIGMDAVALTYGAHDATTLRSRNPSQVFDNMPDLTQWLINSTI